MLPPKGSTTADRRIAARQQVAYRLDVVTMSGNAGCLLDISSSGMRVRFKSELDVSSTLSLSVVFPRWLELGEGIDLSGRFVWVRNTSGGATEAGFAFDGLSRKEDGVLSVLVQRLSEALAEDREGG
jgi:hypothetical protein